MDLRNFYSKIREIEKNIETLHVVVASLETPDGGKAGILTEVARPLAARVIAEGRARLATTEEADAFHHSHAEALRLAEETEAASRMQIAVLREPEVRQIRERLNSKHK